MEEGWRKAGLLSEAYTLIDRTGAPVQIIHVEKKAELQDVYNIEVDEHHTYHVGEIGVWVHNAKCCDLSTPPPQSIDTLGAIPTVTLSRSRFPQTAQHIEEAIAAGRPDTLTIERVGARSRRRDSLNGIETKSDLDRDEFPPAMFEEGGKGSSVKHIDPSDNRGAGSCIGAQCRGLPNGTKIKIEVVD